VLAAQRKSEVVKQAHARGLHKQGQLGNCVMLKREHVDGVRGTRRVCAAYPPKWTQKERLNDRRDVRRSSPRAEIATVPLFKCGAFHSLKEPKDAILDLGAVTNAKGDMGRISLKGLFLPVLATRHDFISVPALPYDEASHRFTKARVDTI
jgi:hypothetical protein